MFWERLLFLFLKESLSHTFHWTGWNGNIYLQLVRWMKNDKHYFKPKKFVKQLENLENQYFDQYSTIL